MKARLLQHNCQFNPVVDIVETPRAIFWMSPETWRLMPTACTTISDLTLSRIRTTSLELTHLDESINDEAFLFSGLAILIRHLEIDVAALSAKFYTARCPVPSSLTSLTNEDSLD